MTTSCSLSLAAAVAAIALGGACTIASARDLSASADVVRDSVAGHAYRNGGIDKDEAAAMARHLKPYDLRLTFSEGRHNAYVADVRLRITDAHGRRVFGLDDAGPMTDVSLPPGRYRVLADFGGVRRVASVDVEPGHPADVFLHWPRDAA